MVKNKHNLENNPYGERLSFVRQFSAYDDLDDINKRLLRTLRLIRTLKMQVFIS
ncbi:hypothetical protein [Candidatus Nanosynbacter lyticus]|uniref:hypothetical protein n=1 Tax=Candidatus Nanosynbacter lyticus TaxID=2093824 RepID=UPI0025544762|nr:hypothetical protein [Candidatus Nanosynbacter lyticus]WLD46536.1 hypothetical protein NLML1_0153 [Candidatus Nanosynbacter lyticus]